MHMAVFSTSRALMEQLRILDASMNYDLAHYQPPTSYIFITHETGEKKRVREAQFSC